MNINVPTKLPSINDTIKTYNSDRKLDYKSLDSLETQRILSILESTIRNCKFIASFDSIFNDLENCSYLIGHNLYMLFLKFKPIYKEYMDLSKKVMYIKNPKCIVCLEVEPEDTQKVTTIPADFWTTPLKSLKKKPKPQIKKETDLYTAEEIKKIKIALPEFEEKIKHMTPLVQYFIRSILSAYNENPEGIEVLMNKRITWNIKQNIALVKFTENLIDLRDILHRKLRTSPNEQDEQTIIMTNIKLKDRKYNNQMNNLRGNIDNLKVENQRLMWQMSDDITKLQKGIYALEIQNKNNTNRIEKLAEKEKKYNTKLHEENMRKLQAEVQDLKNKYKELVEKNRETELVMRRKKWKLENICESWIEKYDNDMNDYQEEYDTLKAEFDEDSYLLEDLEKRFVPLEKEYQQVIEEQKLRREAVDKQKADKEALIYWATVIQSFWRAWKARKAIRKNRRRRR